jgi:MFS family permease
LGLDALTLLKHPDHRVIFITVALFAIPLCGFYPFTPPHLRELGFERTSAWMSIGQITEIIVMFLLGGLLVRWRLKWIIGCGLGFGLLRFALAAVNGKFWLLSGVLMHGVSFTLVFITAQIYLEQRVDAAWRTRAQALMALMLSGVGNLIGYLGTGWWFNACSTPEKTHWSLFWGGLSATVAVVLVYFLAAYRGRMREMSHP